MHVAPQKIAQTVPRTNKSKSNNSGIPPSLPRAPNLPQPCPNTVIKKIASIAILLLPALLAGYLLCQMHGRRSAQITEFKQYSGNMLTLTHWETNHPPELKDFIKAHYYRLANQIPEDWAGSPSNYGPFGNSRRSKTQSNSIRNHLDAFTAFNSQSAHAPQSTNHRSQAFSRFPPRAALKS